MRSLVFRSSYVAGYVLYTCYANIAGVICCTVHGVTTAAFTVHRNIQAACGGVPRFPYETRIKEVEAQIPLRALGGALLTADSISDDSDAGSGGDVLGGGGGGTCGDCKRCHREQN